MACTGLIVCNSITIKVANTDNELNRIDINSTNIRTKYFYY